MHQPLRRLFLSLVAVCALCADREFLPTAPPPQGTPTGGQGGAVGGAFVANHGQWDARARFVLRGDTSTTYLQDDGWTLDLPAAVTGAVQMGTVVRMAFEGALPAQLRPEELLPGVHHYFVGARARWRTDVPRFGAVRYDGLYPGVDVRVRFANGHPEYDLLLQPGADLDAVALRVDGARGLSLAGDGALLVHTDHGALRQAAPHTWSETPAGARTPVACSYRLLGDDRFGFAVDGWQADQALCIDPGLVWSTAVPGLATASAYTELKAVAFEDNGDVTVAGGTGEAAFPTTAGAYQVLHAGARDALVARFDPSQSGAAQLVYATFLGGLGGERVLEMHRGSNGQLTFTGQTSSPRFPVTASAYDTSHNGQGDLFITQLNPAATGVAQLVYSTFYGGSAGDFPTDIVVDDATRVVTVTGDTFSADLPMTANALDPVFTGGPPATPFDGFAAQLDLTRTGAQQLLYSTYLGGPGKDSTDTVFVSTGGLITIGGETESLEFPTTSTGLAPRALGSADGFVVQIDPSRPRIQQLRYGTFIGGSRNDFVQALTADAAGVITLIGATTSKDLPTTANAFAPALNGDSFDVFLMRLDPAQSGAAGVLYSTYLGGTSDDFPADLRIDPDGIVSFAGNTTSVDLPTTRGAYRRTYSAPRNGGPPDVMVVRFDPTRTGSAQLLYGSYLGGNQSGAGAGSNTGQDTAFAMALDGLGRVAVVGNTYSDDFPTTAGAFGVRGASVEDAFATMFDMLPAGVSAFGTSSPGCRGTLAMDCVGIPAVGSVASVECGNVATAAFGALTVSAAPLASPVRALGIDVWVDVFAAPHVLVPTLATGIRPRVQLRVPNQPSLAGGRLFAQFVWVDPGGPPPCPPPQGLSASNALDITIQS